MLKKSVNLLTHAIKQIHHMIDGNKKCINIGCGTDIRPFWINCDIQPKNNQIIKFDITNFKDLQWLEKQEADLINSDHVIGYLTIAQADMFFNACFNGLKEGGKLILEFPDIQKILQMLSNLNYKSENIDYEYIEVIRAIYAYDNKDAMSTNFDMKTYITGWTTDYLIHRLNLAGFKKIENESPLTHGKRIYRDSRIVALK